MYPCEESKVVAEKSATFFNNISAEYQPLDWSRVPVTFERRLPDLTAVVKKIKSSKKPTSIDRMGQGPVWGDPSAPRTRLRTP